MSADLLFVLFLIVLTSVCDTVNHLGLKVCADAAGIQVAGVPTALRFAFRIVKMPLAWVSVFFSLLSLFLWIYALTKADLSFAFSLDSLHHVFILIAARVLLKENVGSRRWLGTIVIVVGIVLVAGSGIA
jgi:drug/metabolite transporter (DMT)-like permease